MGTLPDVACFDDVTSKFQGEYEANFLSRIGRAMSNGVIGEKRMRRGLDFMHKEGENIHG